MDDEKVEGWTRADWIKYYVGEGLSKEEAQVIVAISFGDSSGDVVTTDELDDEEE